jgi:hypothetical protein
MPAWKNSEFVGSDGCVLMTVFPNEPGWPSASAVL